MTVLIEQPPTQDRRTRCPNCGCVVHRDGRGKRALHHYGDLSVCARVRDAEQVALLLGEAFAEEGGTPKAQSQARMAFAAWRGALPRKVRR